MTRNAATETVAAMRHCLGDQTRSSASMALGLIDPGRKRRIRAEILRKHSSFCAVTKAANNRGDFGLLEAEVMIQTNGGASTAEMKATRLVLLGRRQVFGNPGGLRGVSG